MITVNAMIKGVRMSPRKVGLVAALVRGRSAEDAQAILAHTPKRAAKPLAKAIASAQANAITNHRLDGKTLMIQHLEITAGPRLKRFRPAAMGRALPYQKRSSHISVTIVGEQKVIKAAATTKANTTKSTAEKKAIAKKEQK